MSDWIALAGILGTLFGVGVGAFVTWKIQDAQIKHSDAVRFQKERFDAYSQFLYSGTRGITGMKFEDYDIGAVQSFLTMYDRLRLVATDNVLPYANLMHEKMLEIHLKSNNKEDFEDVIKEFNIASGSFIAAVRDELRIRNLLLL